MTKRHQSGRGFYLEGTGDSWWGDEAIEDGWFELLTPPPVIDPSEWDDDMKFFMSHPVNDGVTKSVEAAVTLAFLLWWFSTPKTVTVRADDKVCVELSRRAAAWLLTQVVPSNTSYKAHKEETQRALVSAIYGASER